MMDTKSNLPFRAEHIGSFIRPPNLLAARADYELKKISAADLRNIEDREIEKIVKLQTKLGFSAVTDGEFRRSSYSDSFTTDVFNSVTFGSTDDENWSYSNAAGKKSEARVPRVVDRLIWEGPTNIENFNFLSSLKHGGVPKVTLPGPCYIHFRAGRGNIDREVYPDLDLFWQDIVNAYVSELEALSKAGCCYVQLDETSIAKFGDPKIRLALTERGDHWKDLLSLYTDVINEIVVGAPDEMHIGLHLCRGNKAGSWQADGGYEDVSRLLFQKLAVQFYFLEYDTPRAGGFQALCDVPKNNKIILGLISTKSNSIEKRDEVLRRIEEAATFISIDNLGLSPQCGFSGDLIGTGITFDQQCAKAALIVDIAKEVWGYSSISDI